MLMAHRIALDPSNRRATYFACATGTARFAYNWALAEWQLQYEAWKADNTLPKPSQPALRRRLKARRSDCRGLSLVCEQQDVLGVRPQAGDVAAGSTRMEVSRMRDDSRPRCERGDQLEKQRREFHGVSLWRGRRWLRSKDPSETGLSEAGSQRQICSGMSRFA
jgi:hypothetical protein